MPTWIVVEDEPDLYETLLALFEIWSIDGIAFTNGTDAIRWIEDIDNNTIEATTPELALLDIRLPGVNGDEVARRLRQSPALKDIAIVLITAYHLTPEKEKEILRLAQTKHLIYKPLPDPADFQELLRNAIAGNPK